MRTGLIAGLIAGVFAAGVPGAAQTLAAGKKPQAEVTAQRHGSYSGFDVNEYPGDAVLAALHRHFVYMGFWLNVAPGESANTWHGKRAVVRDAGFGFLVLFNGRLDRELVAAVKGKPNNDAAVKALGERDAADSIEAARAEGFPNGTIIFLDIEEGGRMLPEQAAYIFAWSEAVARSAYRAGVYCSGQPVSEGQGEHITTAEDIQQQVAARHLHPIVLWIAQDACPPAPGCMTYAPPLSEAGIGGIEVWQYAQSPQRKALTAACARTYTKGECVVRDLPEIDLDMNAASSADPSRGR